MKSLTPFYNQNKPRKGLAEALVSTARVLIESEYTSAEIRWAFKRLWIDKTIFWAFANNTPMNPGALIPHIHALRRLQKGLLVPITVEKRDKLCDEFPSELDADDFGIVSTKFNSPNEKMYLYRNVQKIRAIGQKTGRLKTPENNVTTPGDHYGWVTQGSSTSSE